MYGFQNTYKNIVTGLGNPALARAIETPASPQEWKRIFGMMETLERNQIAEFKGGRYVLHPSRKAAVLEQANALLSEISKPLTLPEPQVEVMVIATPAMPEFNVCPTCKGKGRVNIEDTLGFFGNFLCVTCDGKKQIPVPSRDTFPPVDLSKKPESPNALLFSNSKPVAAIPQALEVGGVRVIVEAPVLSMPTLNTQEAAENLVAIAEPATPINTLSDEDTQPLPELVPADCPTCTGSGMAFDTLSEAPYIRVQSCPECGGSGEMQEAPIVDMFADFDTSLDADFSPSDELPVAETIEPIDAMGDGGFVWHDKIKTPATETIADILAQIKKRSDEFEALENSYAGKERESVQKERVILKSFERQLVRVNWTGRGLSSGEFHLLNVIRQYGKTWYMVKVETDRVYYCPVLPELCELVPQPAPKATEFITPKPSLLDGLPIMQTIAQHGVEDTKAALNLVAERVVAEALNGDKLLVAEGAK